MPDKVFLEGSSFVDIIRSTDGARYEGDWNLTVLAPQGMSAGSSASVIYAATCWLEDVCGAKVFDLRVDTSPDKSWSMSLEEKIHSEMYEV